MSQTPDSNPALLLPPDLAKQLQVATLVFSGTTAVLVWDILHHLGGDYCLVFKYKFRLGTAAYFVARVASMIYVLGFTLFASMHIQYANAKSAVTVFSCGLLLSSSATSLLFFLRVRAVYGGKRLVTWIFGFLWVCVVAAAITVPIGTEATRIGTLCLVTKVHSYAGAASTVLMVHDTTVFIAISYRLLANAHHEHTLGQRIRTFFSGAQLHTFSKAVFRDGQKYYMITILSNLITISLVYAQGLSPIYHGMMSIPNVALTSIMACRVYRNATLHPRPRAKSLELSATSNSRTATPRIAVPLSTDRQSSFPAEAEAWRPGQPTASADFTTLPPKSESV
ncbi:hypothetical protein MVEN_00596300 [Mycena venus]|uniref:Uncharacterized protein n=1 Tax=Mycena venus TaxID=2733690 RepID=A0A8H7D8B2_9AGAR|nr:hypothetical protein MVEN_00596300 [Mycena venus]